MTTGRPTGIVTGIAPEELRDLPIFPLPRMVLFPGSLLPLHVFEPRYRNLTRDALQGTKLIGMAGLNAHGGQADPPSVHPILGVGSVLQAEKLPDGRYHLLLGGVARVQIAQELALKDGYRRVAGVLVPEISTVPPALLAAQVEQVLALWERLIPYLGHDGGALTEWAHQASAPGALADLLAAALATDPEQRQSLLETLDPAVRLSEVESLASKLWHELSGGPTTLN